MLTRFLTRLRTRYHPFHRLKQVKLFSKFVLPALDRPVYARLHGVDWPVRVRLMRNLSYVVDNRVVEPAVAALFLAITRLYRPAVFWDVGAHIGFYSWLVLSHDAKARAVLFEPDPDNLRLLAQTVARSRLDRAEILACAVADRDGEAPFLTDTVSGTTGTLVVDDSSFVAREYRLDPDRISVKTVTLDGAAAARPPPELIKIDVEGAEHRVFDGGWSLIRRCQPILVFESFSDAAPALLGKLEDEGYRVLAADEPGAPLSATENFLGLPARLAESQAEFLARWRAELEMWLGAGRRRARGDRARWRRS